MNVLWATTFSADLWECSGKHLINTFLATKTPGRLVAYVEGMDLPVTSSNIEQHRIDNNEVLAWMIKKNQDVIPVALGGALKPPECKCPKGPLDVHSKHHRLPCPGYWFCKNAIRWFRKALAAHAAAVEHRSYDYLIWVDADASFLQTVPPDVVASWFETPKGTASCIYLKHKRDAIETGVFGYNLKARGGWISSCVLARYISGRFRKDARWDDCVQLEYGIRDSGELGVDLATNTGPNNTVIQFSPLGPYLGHDKGRHRRGKKLT